MLWWVCAHLTFEQYHNIKKASMWVTDNQNWVLVTSCGHTRDSYTWRTMFIVTSKPQCPAKYMEAIFWNCYRSQRQCHNTIQHVRKEDTSKSLPHRRLSCKRWNDQKRITNTHDNTDNFTSKGYTAARGKEKMMSVWRGDAIWCIQLNFNGVMCAQQKLFTHKSSVNHWKPGLCHCLHTRELAWLGINHAMHLHTCYEFWHAMTKSILDRQYYFFRWCICILWFNVGTWRVGYTMYVAVIWFIQR